MASRLCQCFNRCTEQYWQSEVMFSNHMFHPCAQNWCTKTLLWLLASWLLFLHKTEHPHRGHWCWTSSIKLIVWTLHHVEFFQENLTHTVWAIPIQHVNLTEAVCHVTSRANHCFAHELTQILLGGTSTVEVSHFEWHWFSWLIYVHILQTSVRPVSV